MLRYLRQKKSLRFVIISSLLTAAALGAAMISAVAGQIGEYELSGLGSKAALVLALIIVIYVVPRLAHSVKLEYLRSEFSIGLPNSGLVFCLLILLVTIIALGSGNNLLYLVLAVMLATIFVSWLASRLSLGRVAVSVRYPDHIFVDEIAPFEATITNRKLLLPTFSAAVAISEQGPASSGWGLAELAYFPIVPAKTRARMRNERSFPRRGIYQVRGFLLVTKFPFGFIEQRRLIEAPSEIVVYPRPQPPEDFINLAPLAQGRIESRLKGSGSDLYAIRQYQSSDHHHHIDWKATAKTTRLMVREFTRDDDWRVTVAFDARVESEIAGTTDFGEKFEKAVVLAASLIDYFISEGAEVRLLAGGEDSGFGIGGMHCYTMLRQLAQLAPQTDDDGGEERTGTLFAPSSGADEQLRVLITPSADSPVARHSPLLTQVITFDEL
jgi:uncharacterized protein (DUF58 family)